MSIKLGITGGIGAGKSVVSHLLEIMGIPVYIADIRSKELTVNDPEIRKKLILLLGEEVYKGRELNKPFLAGKLFGDQELGKQINAIIHPVVKKDFIRWAALQKNKPVVAMEAAILIEAGFTNSVDHTVMVYAPEEIRIRRAIQRDHSTPELIRQRIKNQMNDEQKRALANFIIVNDDLSPVLPQVLEIIRQLTGK